MYTPLCYKMKRVKIRQESYSVYSIYFCKRFNPQRGTVRLKYFRKYTKLLYAVCFWRDSPQGARTSSFTRFLDHTQRRTTVGRTPLYEWSARRRNLYLTTHNTHNRLTSMAPMGFKLTISAGERPQTYALDRAATANGRINEHKIQRVKCNCM